MRNREELNAKFEEILGSENVYFQPPENIKMKYPAIVYNRKNIDMDYADDKIYNSTVLYQATIIDKDPDSKIIEKILELPLTSYVYHFVSDNLNHDVFEIYY